MYYNCEKCGYTTSRKSTFMNHLRSNSHKVNQYTIEHTLDNKKVDQYTISDIQNVHLQPHTKTKPKVNQKYTNAKCSKCPYCKNNFTTKSSLNRHLKRCFVKNDELKLLQHDTIQNNKINEVEKQQMEERINSLENDKKRLNEHIEFLKSLIVSGSQINKAGMSGITFVINNYKDAPPLLALEDYSDLNDSEEMSLVEVLIHYYEKNKLDEFLGEFLVNAYKREDPAKQSLWNSDTTRLTYIIKELIKNQESTWTVDKKGIKTIKNIVNPLLKYLKPLVRDYMLACANQNNIRDTNQLLHFQTKAHNAALILNDIGNGILARDIIKFMAPHFYLSRNDDLKLLE